MRSSKGYRKPRILKAAAEATQNVLTTLGLPQAVSSSEKKNEDEEVSSATSSTDVEASVGVSFNSTIDTSIRCFGTNGTEVAISGTMPKVVSQRETTGTEKKSNTTMRLTLLRGANLSVSNPYCRVLINRDFVGETPPRDETNDPIWGAPSSVFQLRASNVENSEIVLQVLDDPKETVEAELTVKVADLLIDQSKNPNVCLDVFDPATGSPQGQLHVRLLPSQTATIHTQPSAKIIAPGPELPQGMSSYSVRKQVIHSCTPVTLHVYDVSNQSQIADINNYTKAFGWGGIFHGAIEVHGKEYSFGGSELPNVPGIFAGHPRRCPMHNYRESVYLGDCELNEQQVRAILREMSPRWMANTYNLFRRNCCFFCRELAAQLGIGNLPTWVYSLATTAEPLEPYLQQYCAARAAPGANQEATTDAVPLQTPQPTKQREKEGTTVQNHMVDHVMAARMQRFARRYSGRVLSNRRDSVRSA